MSGPWPILRNSRKRQGFPLERSLSCICASAPRVGSGWPFNGNRRRDERSLTNAPHPNAAKVYLNYLLSNEGQVAWSKASGLASLRRDVPRDHIPEILLPQEGISYQETYREKYVLMRREIADFINTVLQR